MTNSRMDRLDRHALVLAIWLSFGFMALVLFQAALDGGGWIGAGFGFALILCGFAGHVIVNTVTGTLFSPREVALGLVLYGAGLIAASLAAILSADFRDQHFLVFGLGMIAIFAGVVFCMITQFGLRRAFESFDIIRRFRD